MIGFDHPRNLALYEAAQARGLRLRSLGSGRYQVSSYTNPAKWHDVFVCDAGYVCACQEPYFSKKACSHGPWAAADRFPRLLALWQLEAESREMEAACERELKGVTRIRAGWRKVWQRSILALVWPYDETPEEMMADIRRLDAEAAEILGVERMKAA